MNDNFKMVAGHGFSGGQWQLNESELYNKWRARKIALAARQDKLKFVEIADLAQPTKAERDLILMQCNINNFGLYTSTQPETDDAIAVALRSFTDSFGLEVAEKHRSQGPNGVVALKVSDQEHQRGYIPYSRKAINWHTDGYYNGPEETIRSFVLHCARPADEGGQNQVIDPEIAYMRLRDQNLDHIAALMADDAMTIPANTEKDGSVRPASIGPVFFVENTKLIMRYTARTRSISWSKTAAPAAAALQHILETESEFLCQTTLKPGQGVLSNNALHTRTGFDPLAQIGASKRLMYRVRFHNRIEGCQNG